MIQKLICCSHRSSGFPAIIVGIIQLPITPAPEQATAHLASTGTIWMLCICINLEPHTYPYNFKGQWFESLFLLLDIFINASNVFSRNLTTILSPSFFLQLQFFPHNISILFLSPLIPLSVYLFHFHIVLCKEAYKIFKCMKESGAIY